MAKYYCLVYILFALVCVFVVCDGLSNGSSRGRSVYKSDVHKSIYNGLGYANGDSQMRQASVSSPRESSKARHGIGLSAWGIIGMLTGIVLLGTVIYYALLFYPILCKKERKYDIMELTSV